MTKNTLPKIVLVGHKSCGKTYFGKHLAQSLNLPFIDSDCLVEKLYYLRHQKKLNCRQIFKKEGEERFRFLETLAIQEACLYRSAVIALGGGSLMKEENQKLLQKTEKIVYLHANKELIKNRLFSQPLPPFLNSPSPETAFNKMFEERNEMYTKIARFTISLCDKKNEQVLAELKQIVEKNH